MRATWERHDIKPGVRAKKPFTMGTGDMVAIHPGTKRYSVVSLDDGLIMAEDLSNEGVAEWFNSNGSVPMDMLPIFEERKK